MESQEAFVLRQVGQRLSLLTSKDKRIDGFFYTQKYMPVVHSGSKIVYNCRMHGRMHIIDNIQINDVPLVQARHDIYLLHYILEICYLFIPVGAVENSVYSFIQDFYNIFLLTESYFHKKILLCKLFAILGMIPDDPQIHLQVQLYKIFSIDKIVSGVVELAEEKIFEQWIRWCLSEYSHGKSSKALSFLVASGHTR